MLTEAFQETWESVLEPYASDPSRAFILAQTFSILQQTIAKGPEGPQEAIAALELGIKELYQYTDVHEACYVLYERLVKDGLDPSLDPRATVRHLNKANTVSAGACLISPEYEAERGVAGGE
ncbi:MAG: hypothetical protein ACREBG_09235 [Pyrinomonadaceae bacterium]